MNGYIDLNTKEGMDAAVEWTQVVIDTLKDGGVWAVPCCGSLYTFFKSKKQFSVVGAGDPAIDRVLRTMGWSNITNN